MSDFYSLGQVAKVFGVTPITIRRWERAGKFPLALRLPGGHRRWRKEAVEAILNQQMRENA